MPTSTEFQRASPRRIGILSLGLGALSAATLFGATGLVLRLARQGTDLIDLVAIVSFIGQFTFTFAALILALAAVALESSSQRIVTTIAASAQLLIIAIATSRAEKVIPREAHLPALAVIQSIFAAAFTHALGSCLRVSPLLPRLAAATAGVVVLLTTSVGLFGKSWLSDDEIIATLPLARDIGITIALCGLAWTLAYAKSFRLGHDGALAALKRRLPDAATAGPVRQALALAILGVALSLVLSALSLTLDEWMGTPAPNSPPRYLPLALGFFSWGVVGLMPLSWFAVSRDAAERQSRSLTSRLASLSAWRFIHRHRSSDTIWATAVGLRTANFTIDHDPTGILEAKVPATLLQIRSDEVQRLVSEMIGSTQVHAYSIGQRVYGALDPEQSVRPLVETLILFTCLYLDATPLVERRIEILTTLLPLVDPGLSKVIDPVQLKLLLRRSHWFFHVDYGWIDQIMVHTPRRTHYDVRLPSLSHQVKAAMLAASGQGSGHLIWLGAEARDRLLLESPMLRSAIDSKPIVAAAPGATAASAAGSKGEAGPRELFGLRFEPLIPRLQRYHGLDQTRAALQDYEPSADSLRLIRLLELQVSKAKRPTELLDIVKQLASLPWRGFMEKDHALRVVIQAYQRLGEFLTPGRSLTTEPRTAATDVAIDQLLEAISAIGYPSQVLHRAQLRKQSLRSSEALIRVALSPSHPRFAESWLLLAASDHRRRAETDQRTLLEFIADLGLHPLVARQPLVQVKAIESLGALAGAVLSSKGLAASPLVDRVLGHVARWLAASRPQPDCLSFLLDIVVGLAEIGGHGFRPSPETRLDLQHALNSVLDGLPRQAPAAEALLARWQDLSAGRSLTDATTAAVAAS